MRLSWPYLKSNSSLSARAGPRTQAHLLPQPRRLAPAQIMLRQSEHLLPNLFNLFQAHVVAGRIHFLAAVRGSFYFKASGMESDFF